MRYLIYPLVKGREGRRRGEFPLGMVEFSEEEGPQIDCPDYGLQRQLSRLFAAPILVRHALGDGSRLFAAPILVRHALGDGVKFLSYTWEEAQPGSREHFEELVHRLHLLGLSARPEELPPT